MKELIIKKEDLDEENYYKEDSIDFEGNLIIEENLGYVKFKLGVSAKFNIISKAGSGIEAGDGIEAGLSIICKGILKFSYNTFAGICYWRELKEEDKLIQCGKLETDGKIQFGNLKEIGIKLKGAKHKITIDNKEIEISEESYQNLKEKLI